MKCTVANSVVTLTVLATACAQSFSLPPNVNLSKSYAPVYVECPAKNDVQWIRPASKGLNPHEAEWVHLRKQALLPDFVAYLARAGLKDFDLATYVCALKKSNYSAVPTLGYAISGGGFASAFTGTGGMRALDSRVPGANAAGTGGLLQSLTYISGLSGGSWPTMSFTTSNFPTADEIVDSLWKPQYNREASNVNASYAETPQAIFDDVAAKYKAGFNVSVSDYLGRAFGFEFINGPNGGLNVTMSGVRNVQKFRDHAMPMPLVQVTQIVDGDPEYFGVAVPKFSNSTLFELTPFEFGAWRGDIEAFTPMEYLGTRLSKGTPVNDSRCVLGFDRASFIIGTSAGAFNFYYIENRSNGTLAPFAKRSFDEIGTRRSILDDPRVRQLSKRQNSSTANSGSGNTDSFPPQLIELFVEVFNTSFHQNVSDISYTWYPNPFLGLDKAAPEIRSKQDLRLVDGSEGGSALPLIPQAVPERNSDFVMAWEDTGDAAPFGWNNGSNMRNAYLAARNIDLPFALVPGPTTFIKRNYTHKPVFFGCYANLTSANSTKPPIVAYFANAPYSTYSNISYTASELSRSRIYDLWINNWDQISQANGTLDSEWPSCLACAAVDRSLERIGMARTKQCQQCFDKYCWDGTSEPEYHGSGSLSVDLRPVLDPGLSYAEWNSTVGATFGIPPNDTASE